MSGGEPATKLLARTASAATFLKQDDGGVIDFPDSVLSSAAFLSTMPPLLCGIATFTANLMGAVSASADDLQCLPVSVCEAGPAEPGLIVRKHDLTTYRRAGQALQAGGIDVLCVQHEYGIFGGPDGEMVLDLLDAAPAIPVVVTLHTVLDRPGNNQRRVMTALLDRADAVVVMTDRSARIVQALHGVEPGRLHVVPHGIPQPSRKDRDACRRALRLDGRPTMLTFGLLSPGKGIEHAIRALPALVRRWPDMLYVVMGATHPNLVRENGEAYRDSLIQLAGQLGVLGNVRFVNRFVELPELTDALRAADVYVTPYVNEAQSVSGTLSYSYGLGTPVVSTPYQHAVELLADGRGVLVPFADPRAIADAVLALLSDPERQAAMREAAWQEGRRMLWPSIGARYLEIFRAVASRSLPAGA